MTQKNNLLSEKDTQIGEKDHRLEELVRQQEVRHTIQPLELLVYICALVMIQTQEFDMCTISQVFQADLTAKDDIIARKSRELRNKETQLAQKDEAISTFIADKEATIAEREALIQVARPAVTLCPTLVHLLCCLRCSLTCTGTQGTD